MKQYLQIGFVVLLVIFGMGNLPARDGNPSEKKDVGKVRLIRLHYENSSGEKGITTFEYDKNGMLYKALWQLLDGSRNSINTYYHDKNGKLIKKYREFSDKKTSTQLYKYNQNGKLIQENFERSDGVKGVTTYEYDKNGRRVLADCKGLNGWFFGEILTKYDERDRKTEAILKKDGKKNGDITYSYDGNGNLVKEHWAFGNSWSQTFSYEYEKYAEDDPTPYTSSNVLINIGMNYRLVKENYDYSKKSGGPSFFEYDGSGKLVRKIFQRSDGLETVTDYFYDSDNRLIKSLRRYSSGKSSIFTYKYDQNRKLINRSFICTDGSTGSEAYQYDENGTLNHGVYNNVDSWLTGTIAFHYHPNGYLLRGHFTGEKRNDAEITFTYDKNQNLIDVHWTFSSGETQTYHFEYEKIQ